MLFLNTKTGEYPRHIGDLELLGWKQGEPLPENWVEVQYSELPSVGQNETYQELEPKSINGIYYQNLVVRPMTEDEIARRDFTPNATKRLEELGFSPAEIAAIKLGL